MEIITKNYYSNGTQIRHGDLVYLKGYDSNQAISFSGICKVATFNGELFLAYFLGQEPCTNYDIEMYIEDIERLIKLDSREIDEALSKTVEKLQLKIGNKPYFFSGTRAVPKYINGTRIVPKFFNADFRHNRRANV